MLKREIWWISTLYNARTLAFPSCSSILLIASPSDKATNSEPLSNG